MAEVACRNCHFYDKDKQVCNNPSRDDKKCVFYYGHLNPNSYCALFMPEVTLDVKTKNTTK